ncbi:MAG: hypothetical protein ACREFP_23375 [Acetobacteraceae bacterium]
MARVVTINRPEVVALIEQAANKLTAGNKTDVVALGMRRLLDETARAGSLFGAHLGSVRVGEGIDLIAPALDVAHAIALAAPLVTYDERILRFARRHGRQYRFAVQA